MRLSPSLPEPALVLLCAAVPLGGFGGFGGGRGYEFPGRSLLAADLDEAVALGEALGSRGRCIGGSNEAVPAPQVTFTRDEPLAGLQGGLQSRPELAFDDADL